MAIITTNMPVSSTIGRTLSSWEFDTAPYGNQINVFRNTATTKPLSGKDLVDILVATYQFDLGKNREDLENLLGSLPEDLRLGAESEAGDGVKLSLLQRISILPLLKLARDHINKGIDGNSKERNSALKKIDALEKAITAGYVKSESDLIKQNMTVENANVADADITLKVQPTVESENYVPVVGRGIGAEATPLLDASLTPVMDSNFPWMQDIEANIAIGGDTYESYLRRNPQSSILDIAALEKSPDGGNISGAFDVTNFEAWMASGRPSPAPRRPNFWGSRVTQSNDIPAANKQTWNAYEAINYVYKLDEKGDTNKIKEIQEMLRQTGYFPPDSQYGLPVPGVLDQATVVGWNMFLTDAARAKETPKDFWLKRLNEQKAIRAGRVAIESPVDPLKTASAFQQTAMDVLGRRLSGAEERALFSKLKEWQREIMTFGLEATDQPFDFDARVESYIRDKNQGEIMTQRMAELPAFIEEWFN